jgi:hypothetical protein
MRVALTHRRLRRRGLDRGAIAEAVDIGLEAIDHLALQRRRQLVARDLVPERSPRNSRIGASACSKFECQAAIDVAHRSDRVFDEIL